MDTGPAPLFGEGADDESRFQAISYASPLGIFQTDDQGQLFYVNGRWESLFGLAEPLALGDGWLNAVHPVDRPAVLHAWRQAVAQAQPFDMEFRLRRLDGSEGAVRMQARPGQWGEPPLRGFIGVAGDISQRLAVEQDLRRANVFLERAERLSGVGSWEVDLRTHAVRWSEQCCRIHELPPGHQPSYAQLRSFFDSDGLERIDAAARRAILEDQPWDLELPIRTATGRRLTVRSVGCAEFEDGRAVRLAGAMQDVSEQKAARDALAAVNARLASLVENLPCGVTMFDGQHRLVMHNRQARILLDQPARLYEDPDVRFEDFIRFNAERGDYGPGPVDAIVQDIVARVREPVPQQSMRRQANGVILDVRRSPLPDGGFVTTYVDITQAQTAEEALRRSEERQRRAMEASRLTLWDLDLQTGRLYLSENWAELLGHGRQPTVTTMDALVELVPPEEQAPLAESFMAALRGTSERYANEHRVRRADGNYIWVLSEGRVTQRDREGRAITFSGTNRDISARKAAEADLHKARADAEAANRAKSEFLDTMSHEMRTPLNGVLGMTRLLLGEDLTPQQRRYVELADASAAALLALVGDLLDLGKIEAGKLDLEAVPFRLDPMLQELAELYRLRGRERDLAFEIDVAPGLPSAVVGDPGRLRQILNNLLSNALKFTERGSFGLSVGPAGAGRGTDMIRFTVFDTGIGIPPEVQQRLFTRFTQADSSTTRKYGGSGLGLAIVRQLAEQMGGTLLLQSEVGRGSSFRCELPLPAASDAPLSLPMPPQPRQRVQQTGRILVADDSPTNQVVVRGLLGQAGWDDVTVVGDGAQAIAALARETFDVVLMDCRMPVIDGYQATARLRLDGCRVPIIALTATASETERRRCLRCGMDDYLTKPIDAPLLADTLRHWVGRPTAFTGTPSLFGDLAPPDAAAVASAAASLAAEPVETVRFDRSHTLAALGGNEQLLAAGLAAFRQNAPQVMRDAQSALAAGQAEDLHRHLHSLAGSSGMMGAEPIYRLARQLEQQARDGHRHEVARRLPELARLLDRFVAESAGW
jgi:PAS domain S-box-containing protein